MRAIMQLRRWGREYSPVTGDGPRRKLRGLSFFMVDAAAPPMNAHPPRGARYARYGANAPRPSAAAALATATPEALKALDPHRAGAYHTPPLKAGGARPRLFRRGLRNIRGIPAPGPRRAPRFACPPSLRVASRVFPLGFARGPRLAPSGPPPSAFSPRAGGSYFR